MLSEWCREIMSFPEPSSLAQQWARKYIDNLSATPMQSSERKRGLRADAANRLLDLLRQVSLRAWAQTEAMLGDEIRLHEIDRRLVNPWEISQDTFKIYEKALEFYTQDTSYSRLPALIGPDVVRIRKKYTATDPRVIAFVSLQFHYTGSMLQGHLSSFEKSLLENCFQVIDDHLYMPLHRAYSAAGKHPANSLRLVTAQKILEFSSEISEIIVQKVAQFYPGYKSYSGLLSDPLVTQSSQRDVVMFQIYLVVCMLEQSPSILQDELFPLCIMLYPKLKVHWELIRQMLHFIGQEVRTRLGEEQLLLFSPYLLTLRDMFSPEVFCDE
jgi:Phycobilisome protein